MRKHTNKTKKTRLCVTTRKHSLEPTLAATIKLLELIYNSLHYLEQAKGKHEWLVECQEYWNSRNLDKTIEFHEKALALFKEIGVLGFSITVMCLQEECYWDDSLTFIQKLRRFIALVREIM